MSRLGLAHRIVAALALGAPAGLHGQTSAAPPAVSRACASAEHRHFDFWIGEWEVRRADGTLAGHNTIAATHGGCVLEERYVGAKGYSGGSLNIYDASRRRWHQTWVDNGGLLLELDGEFRHGRMVLRGETVDSAGKKTAQRVSWQPLSGGKVRQLWEQSSDAGASWSTVFDGIYTRTRRN
jgi:hypothetical protein